MSEGKIIEVNFQERRGRTELITKMAEALVWQREAAPGSWDAIGADALVDSYSRELNPQEIEQAQILSNEGLPESNGDE
jgi:hypothetical protein